MRPEQNVGTEAQWLELFHWSDCSGAVAASPIAVRYAVGLAVHYRWYVRIAVHRLSLNEPLNIRRWR
jgi:hypothetical protein